MGASCILLASSSIFKIFLKWQNDFFVSPPQKLGNCTTLSDGHFEMILDAPPSVSPGTKEGRETKRWGIRVRLGGRSTLQLGRAEPTGWFVRYYYTSQSAECWGFCQGEEEKKKAGPPPHVTTTFAWVVNRRRASWQPTLLTCSSTTRSAGPAATFICFFRPAAAATCVCLFSRTSQPEKVRSQQHKLIVDLWPQLESFR